MRRLAATAVVVAIALAATAALVWAAPQPIVGKNTDKFGAANYDLAGGTVATLTTDGSTHNVTASALGADGKPLFYSATISGGPAPVNGTQFLPAGDYAFVCTIHPGMASNLKVTGTPLPRPTATVRILSTSLDRVVGKGKLKVSIATAASTVKLDAKLGTKTIGSATVPAGTTPVKLTKAGRKALAKKSTARVAVTVMPAFGVPASASRKLK